MEYANLAYNLCVKKYGINGVHPHYAKALYLLGKICNYSEFNNKNKNQGIEFLQKGLNICEKLYEKHSNT